LSNLNKIRFEFLVKKTRQKIDPSSPGNQLRILSVRTVLTMHNAR
jgi:hypothetical protein